jgi:hypothetical protein
MKTYSSDISAYRGAQREYYQIDLLSFKVRDRSTGDPHWFHFSSRDNDETISVIDQESGDAEFRDYFGGGHIVALDPLVRSEGTGVRNLQLVLSGTSDEVQDMIEGYDCRDAVFEWRIGEGRDDTGLLIDTPVVEFDGFVDTADREDAAVAVDGDEPADTNFRVSVVSHIAALQQANPDMRSHEVGQERNDDDIFLYAGEANTWDVLWGKGGHKHKHDGPGGGGGHHGKNGHSPDPQPWGHR